MTIINDIGTVMLSRALDATVLRQQAIAQNLANANVPGYHRLSVQFEAQLAAALRANRAGTAIDVAPRLVQADHAVGNEGTDQDLAQLSETVLHHHALLKVLDNRIGLLGTAISEGKK
jgi:flagellar basal-body rod protein FlgB